MPQYAIAQPEGARKASLYEVRNSPGGLLGRVPDETRYEGGPTIRLRAGNVILQLGESPPYGKVYDVLVEPIVGRWIVPRYGTVYDYVGADEAVQARIGRALLQSRRHVTRLYPRLHEVEWMTRLRHPRSKMIAATYGYRPADVDCLTLYTDATVGGRELVKIGSHEMCHGVWRRVFTPEERSVWIKHYGRFVSVDIVDVRAIRALVRGMRQIGSVRDYLKDVTPEDAASAGIYLGWIKKVHGLSVLEVGDLLASGEELPIPDAHLHRGSVNTPVTLYSKENPEEMFCEAVSSHVVGDLENAALIKMIEGS